VDQGLTRYDVDAQVDMVLVPATTGDFGVLPGHVPTVSQLRPGVVSVHVSDKDVQRYFVSGGFCFVHADSTTDICAVEAVPVEQLDPEAVKKGLAEHQAKFVNAKDDVEKAHAQIGIDCCNAMVSAIEGK
jgi:F-type H+-transporting ATPase subunit delta